ncbi:MAG TPA: hypothetical protein VF783_17645, partial [Terriglobales bacterium]
FVTSLVTIPASQLESCQFEGQPCSGVTLIPNSFLPDIGVRKDVFLVDAGLNPGPGLRFQQGAFDAPGVYFDLSNTALLSVKTLTFTPSSEPSTMLLTGSGVLAVALIIRGKLGIQQ